jgi:hypothetical protein
MESLEDIKSDMLSKLLKIPLTEEEKKKNNFYGFKAALESKNTTREHILEMIAAKCFDFGIAHVFTPDGDHFDIEKTLEGNKNETHLN